jgi:hypothetical protein
MKTHPETCKRKRTYPRKKEAEAEAAHNDLTPYHCNVCGKWHLSKYKEKR